MRDGAVFPEPPEAARDGALGQTGFLGDFCLCVSSLGEREDFAEKHFVDGHVCGCREQKFLSGDLAGRRVLGNYAFFLKQKIYSEAKMGVFGRMQQGLGKLS